MNLINLPFVHQVRSRKGDFILYYRRAPDFRKLIGRSTQVQAILEKEYKNAEDTYLQFHCKRQLPSKKDVVGRLVRGAAERAKKYNREINISSLYVRSMLVDQGFRCALTGIEFSMLNGNTSHIRPFGPSIDRIDNSCGYVSGNIRIVCNIANIARNAFSDAEFYRMCVAASEVGKRSKNGKGIQVVRKGKQSMRK